MKRCVFTLVEKSFPSPKVGEGRVRYERVGTSPQSSPNLGEGGRRIRHARVKFAPLITRQAFTLVELLVVIAIIGLLSSVAVVALSSSRMNARNAKRKADLVQISKALELYYADHGSYPSTGGIAAWRGTCSSFNSWPDIDPEDYPVHTSWIPGMTNENYMASLPRDPLTEKNNPNAPLVGARTAPSACCYLYTSNGFNYKLLAHYTPEGPWGSSDPFYDPTRPNWAWQVTDNLSVTSGW